MWRASAASASKLHSIHSGTPAGFESEVKRKSLRCVSCRRFLQSLLRVSFVSKRGKERSVPVSIVKRWGCLTKHKNLWPLWPARTCSYATVRIEDKSSFRLPGRIWRFPMNSRSDASFPKLLTVWRMLPFRDSLQLHLLESAGCLLLVIKWHGILRNDQLIFAGLGFDRGVLITRMHLEEMLLPKCKDESITFKQYRHVFQVFHSLV